jgi:hypothetical protein
MSEAALQQNFEGRIEKDEKIEPNDFMPDNYRKTLFDK